MAAETDSPAEGREGDADRVPDERDETVLRAKYADFCSAQLTEVFLSLSDERIYELVEEEAERREIGAGHLGFRKMVKLATQRLRESVPLPDYETWKRDYRAEPERYERYLLGLWKRLAEGAGERVPEAETDRGEEGEAE